MRRNTALFVSILLAAASLFLYFSQKSDGGHRYAIAYLERVVDGDTAWVRSVYGFKAGQSFKVRFADIDTPERGEKGFSEATSEANALLSTAPCIILEVDDPPYDRYGRVVAIVYVPRGGKLLNVNKVLADNGFARYVDYPGSIHPEDFSLLVHIPHYIRPALERYCKR